MPEFGFTEAQSMWRKQMREFVAKEITPGARERAQLDHIPADMTRKLAGFGILGMNLPEEYGGHAADWVSNGIAVEEVARGDFYLSMTCFGAGIAATLQDAPEALRSSIIPRAVRGELRSCACITEPGHGSDVAGMETVALRKGDHYVLRGEKGPITHGMTADVAMVYAKTDPAAGARGVTAFLVPLDSPGVTRTPYLQMGWKPLAVAQIRFDDVSVPVEHRLGEEGKGFYSIMGQFDFYRVCEGLMAIGAADISLEEAVTYARQRTAFGKPIGMFQGVAFRLAECATRLDAARLLAYRPLWMKDVGLRHTREASMVKWLCPQVAVDVIHQALLVHGQVGFSAEVLIQQRLRDTMGMEIADGTAEIQKLIVARDLLGRDHSPQ